MGEMMTGFMRRVQPFGVTTVVGAVMLLTFLTLTLAGCGAESRDLEGVEIKNPDKAEIYANVEGHPNVTRLCIGGLGWATTSREQNSLIRVTEWDNWCRG